MYSTILSGTVLGMESCLVQVEVDLSAGLPCFIMVGHLSGEVRESAERVRIALKNNGIHLPAMHIAVNLSPADVRKEGTGFDLPVALAVLTAMERLTEKETEGMMILGELGLNGEIRKVRGILPMVGEGLRAGITRFLVPLENLQEARLIGKGRIAGIGSLTEAVEYLKMSEAEQKEWENKSIRELMTEKQDDLLQGNETEMGFFGGIWTGKRQESGNDRSSRISSSAFLRTAGLWQNHAGKEDPYDPASSFGRGETGGCFCLQHSRTSRWNAGILKKASLCQSSSFPDTAGTCGRRCASKPWRGQSGTQRGTVS